MNRSRNGVGVNAGDIHSSPCETASIYALLKVDTGKLPKFDGILLPACPKSEGVLQNVT